MKCVHVLRKPCSESTVAANVLRHGTGAMNIDGCRVGVDTDRAARYGGRAPKGRGIIAFAGTRPEPWVVLPGRWPANLILQHLEGCVQDGVRNVRSSDRPGHGHKQSPVHIIGPSHRHSEVRHGNLDGTETVAAWTCAPGCPVARLDAQSGELRGRGNTTSLGHGSGSGSGVTGWGKGRADTPPRPELNDSGGASRFFKQVGGQDDR